MIPLALGIVIGFMWERRRALNCEECGVNVGQVKEHTCNLETMVAHQAVRARIRLEQMLRRHAEFQEWLRERGRL